MLSSIESAIKDIKEGKLIIVVDNEDRENEGDFICAAETITPDIVNFMATQGRGLICAPLEQTRADELNLPLMVRSNTALHETAFTVSIDLIGHGCSTGISTYDRALTIKALTDQNMVGSDFARPGHIFPLRAKSGGVLQRTGHTEATIDLARMAGLKPVGALVEILNEDGSMARMPQLLQKAKQFDLKIISISDLVAYRLQSERLVKLDQQWTHMMSFGPIEIIQYSQYNSNDKHIAFVKGNINSNNKTQVRVQYCDAMSELIDLFIHGSSSKLKRALDIISKAESGVLLLITNNQKESQALDNIIHSKIEIPKQEQDLREIGIGAQILKDLGIRTMSLITNNPRKNIALNGYGLDVEDYIAF